MISLRDVGRDVGTPVDGGGDGSRRSVDVVIVPLSRTQPSANAQGSPSEMREDGVAGSNTPSRVKGLLYQMLASRGVYRDPDLSRTDISSKETRPSGKYVTIISRSF